MATSSRAVAAVGQSSTNQHAPPPPIFSNQIDHPPAVLPYRQRYPTTRGRPRATIGKHRAEHRCASPSKPRQGNRSTRSPTKRHPQRDSQRADEKHQHPARWPSRDRLAPVHLADKPTNHDTTARRNRTETAAPNRPAVFPVFFPPWSKKVTPRTRPPGKHTPQATQAPTPNAPRATESRRPSTPTT